MTSLAFLKKRIAVVMGGWSGEREVSLSSGVGVMVALQDQGYTPIAIDLTSDISMFIQKLQAAQPDIVCLNALHGRWGEDGCLQGLLEMLGYPYTSSGVLASALAMDKSQAKKIFRAAGLPTPDGIVASFTEVLRGGVLPVPYVIKPLQEGSSLGVSIITDENQLSVLTTNPWIYGDHVLVECYIPGREIQVAVLGDRAWGAIELRPKEGFYDYVAKYTDGKTDHIMPADLPPPVYAQALDLGLQAHLSLGCEGVSRVDLRYDDTQENPGHFYILEVNTQPGLTPLSLVPEIVAYYGMSYGDLLEWAIKHARVPYRLPGSIEKSLEQNSAKREDQKFRQNA